jgi:preprotein translocase subunit SecE
MEKQEKKSFLQKLSLVRSEIKQVHWGDDAEIKKDVVIVLTISIIGSLMMLFAGSISKTVIEYIVNFGKN